MPATNAQTAEAADRMRLAARRLRDELLSEGDRKNAALFVELADLPDESLAALAGFFDRAEA